MLASASSDISTRWQPDLADLSLMGRLARLSPGERSRVLRRYSTKSLGALQWDWPMWARSSQLEPDDEDWVYWLMLAGRGSGKSRAGSEWIRAVKDKCSPIALVGMTAADVRDVMIEGPAGLQAISPPDDPPDYQSSKRRVEWRNGAVALLFSAEEPDRLRGPQFAASWCFTAGTAILAPGGEAPIEALAVGDLVVTRDGPKPVGAVSARPAPVGRVRFSNGRSLIGTADHPVLTSHGWMRLSDLREGTLCAASASSSAADVGIDIRAIATGSSAAPEAEAAPIAIGSIEQSGDRLTAPFPLAMMFVFSTAIGETSTPIILNACRGPISGGTISNLRALPRSLLNGGRKLLALIVENPFSAQHCTASAHHASTNEPTRDERHFTDAKIAELSSCRSKENSVASVVSTWEPAGDATVFNLRIAETPEFFANGILVHNCDELASWGYPQETWDNLQFGMRLGAQPRTLVTTTPRPIKLLRTLLKDRHTRVTRTSSYANRVHLAPSYFEKIIKRHEGTRLGRQEIYAELLEDAPGALWNPGVIEDNRLPFGIELPEFTRIVVAIDPAATADEDSDETGIIVAAKDRREHGYVLADRSGHYLPSEWAKIAIAEQRNPNRPADRVIAEINNGGEMVENTLRMIEPGVPYKAVHASRGKVVRAEPVSALYEQQRVHHVGMFPVLEDQMINFSQDWDRAKNGSPDRVDALVWAISELLVEDSGPSYLAAWGRW